MSTTHLSMSARAPDALASGARRYGVPLVLAVPYVIAIAMLRGLTVALPTFHGRDEYWYHYPVILRFAHQLPFPDLGHYPAAQTPLFHLLLAYVGKVIGFELWRLRLVEALISYAAALVLFVLLERRVGLPRVVALALTLLFALSPYVYGASFRLLTDNLAILFTLVALERFERFRESDRLGPFVVGCVSAAAATLTRQSAAYLVGIAALYGLRGRRATRGWHALREKTLVLGVVGASVVPVAVLFLIWHGLVPPGGDPASCGLCAAGSAGSAAHGPFVVRSTELALATTALYGTVLFAPLLLTRLRGMSLPSLSELTGPLLAAAVGVLMLLLWPTGTPTGSGAEGAGLIWRAAGHFPSVFGTSLVFWMLVPLAGVIVWARLRTAPRPGLVAAFFGCFLLSTLVIRFPWQKYVDPFALLAIILTVRPDDLARSRDFAGLGVLLVAFVGYTLTFVT